MKIIKPSWIHHDGFAILSGDFHPDGVRFATCGQGKNGGIIMVWRINDLLKEEYSSSFIEKDKCKITELDDHVGCVNCVKWSPDGKMLASGADDKTIILWKQARIKNLIASNKSFNEHEESWRCTFRLTAHTADVLDLRWSPTGEFLASCSIDSSIIIWDRSNFPSPLATFTGHTGFVKGVCWDPIGEYLASQSDDNSIRIWNVYDLKNTNVDASNNKNTSISNCVSIIRKPFKHCTATTQFLRLDWSPDGQFIISTHSLNNKGPVAKIIQRNKWTCDRDLVGHRKAITCVKFNTKIFGSIDSTDMNMFCAIGSRDCGLSIWQFPYKRPLVVIHDLFYYPIMDISWTSDGKNLAAVSWDGTAAFINLDKEPAFNIKSLTPDEIISIHKELYGKSILEINSKVEEIIDDIEFAKLHNTKSKAKPQPIENTVPKLKEKSHISSDNSSTLPDILQTNQQVETITKDGKRRIKPILIAQTLDEDEESADIIVETIKTNEQPAVNKEDEVNSPLPKKSFHELLQLTPKKRTQVVINTTSKKQKLKKEKSSAESFKTLEEVEKLIQQKQTFEEPKIENTNTIKIKYKNDETLTVIINNIPLCKEPEIYRINALNNNTLEWTIMLTSQVSTISYSQDVICFSTTDSQIHIISITGIRLLSPIVFKHKIAFLKVHTNQYIMAVSITGLLSVWNIVKFKNKLNYVNLNDILFDDMHVKSVNLSPSGTPIAITNTNNSFTYNIDMCCWVPIASEYCNLSNVSFSKINVPNLTNTDLINQYQELYKSSNEMFRGLSKCDNIVRALCNESFLEVYQHNLNKKLAKDKMVYHYSYSAMY